MMGLLCRVVVVVVVVVGIERWVGVLCVGF